ncbi:ferritin heavy chain-like isoform X1 [Panulirus ornatus]|uniref:ferritin heavy chain-like isoform X1 n=1 Tax=Panulirus ornatus TaxID=150431 RepID=UPI003A845614
MGRLVQIGIILLGCFAAAVISPAPDPTKSGDGATSSSEDDNYHCQVTDAASFPGAVCFIEGCASAIKDHIAVELNAAFMYMYMGAHFAQDSVDRPGIANFMFEAATEERGHAVLMLNYLNTRGIFPGFNHYEINLSNKISEKMLNGLTYQGALEAALKLEIEVTNLIYSVTTKCLNDYHGADVFTNPILDEQHESIRKLQGALQAYKASRIVKESSNNEIQELGEYIFDRKMLNGEF